MATVSKDDYDRLLQEFNSLALAKAAVEGEVKSLQSVVNSNGHKPRLVGANPGKFSGDRKAYAGWIGQVKFHFKVNENYYQSDIERVGLIVASLEGKARDWSAQFMENDPEGVLGKLDLFMTKLETAFGDPHKALNAAISLKNLKQGSRSVDAYFAEFATVTLPLGFNDNALRFHFREGLNESVKDDLAGCAEEPNSLDKLKELAASCDRRRFERRLESGPKRPTWSRPVSTHVTHSQTAPMEIGAIADGPRRLSAEEKLRRLKVRATSAPIVLKKKRRKRQPWLMPFGPRSLQN